MMRYRLTAILGAIVVCPALAWAGEIEPTPVVEVHTENGQPRMEILGQAVGQARDFTPVRMPEGYPRGPLIEEESAERLGVVSSTESVNEPTGDLALLQQKVAELDRLQAEIDELREATGTPRQIVVNIEMLEVSLTKLRRVGVAYHRDPGGMIVATDVAKLRLARGHTGPGAPADVSTPEDGSIAEFISLLKQNNIAKTLANPSIVTMSGKQASFHVGGEFPLPATPGSEAAVQFKEFGTRVDLLTKLLGNNRVRLAIRPRISEIDDSRAIEIAGLHVPALRMRECAATCDVQLGETFALGGPSENRIEAIQRGGRVEEVVNEIGFWVVVRADATTAMDPQSASGR